MLQLFAKCLLKPNNFWKAPKACYKLPYSECSYRWAEMILQVPWRWETVLIAERECAEAAGVLFVLETPTTPRWPGFIGSPWLSCVSRTMCGDFPPCTGTSFLELQTKPKYSHKSLHVQGKSEMMIPVYVINSTCYSHTALLNILQAF